MEQPKFPQFYLTNPAPCPYLPDRRERKVFTQLSGPRAKGLNDTLTHFGFRRSQTIAYRPACDGCDACVSVRIIANEFERSRSQNRLLRRNADLTAQKVPAEATEEQFRILRRYLDARHADGGMADMTVLDYVSMVEDTAVETFLTEYRDAGGTLVAVALTDQLKDGLSMVYSFYSPEETTRSLGSYMILDHIEKARTAALPYVYLGYWIENCRKMSYKAKFQPLQALGHDGWKPLKLSKSET